MVIRNNKIISSAHKMLNAEPKNLGDYIINIIYLYMHLKMQLRTQTVKPESNLSPLLCSRIMYSCSDIYCFVHFREVWAECFKRYPKIYLGKQVYI